MGNLSRALLGIPRAINARVQRSSKRLSSGAGSRRDHGRGRRSIKFMAWLRRRPNAGSSAARERRSGFDHDTHAHRAPLQRSRGGSKGRSRGDRVCHSFACERYSACDETDCGLRPPAHPPGSNDRNDHEDLDKRLIAGILPTTFALALLWVGSAANLWQFLELPTAAIAVVLAVIVAGLTVALIGWRRRALIYATLTGLAMALAVFAIAKILAGDREEIESTSKGPAAPSIATPEAMLVLDADLVPGTIVTYDSTAYGLDERGAIVALEARSGTWTATKLGEQVFPGATALSSCIGSLLVAYDQSHVARVSRVSGRVGEPWSWPTEVGQSPGQLKLACDGTYAYVAKADAGFAVRLGSPYLGPGLDPITNLSDEFKVGDRADSITATRSGQLFAADTLEDQLTITHPNEMTELVPAVPEVLATLSEPGSQLVVNGRVWASQNDSGCLAVIDASDEARLRPDIQLQGGALHLVQSGDTVVAIGQADGRLTLLNANDPRPGEAYTAVNGHPTDVAAVGEDLIVVEGDVVSIYSLEELRRADSLGHWSQGPCTAEEATSPAAG